MKIFLSYSRDDAGNFAKHVHRYLRNIGHAVFIDVNSINIGEPWADSIEKNISECDIFIVILTPDSLRSSHVEREVLQAQIENKIIVPCIHEHVEYNEIKWRLQENQGIEFSDKYELALNLYPKIKNYTNKVNEKPSFVPQQKIIQDTNISEDVYILNEKGNILKNQGKYKEAIEYYNKALELDSTNTYALTNKGHTLYRMKKFKESIKTYEKVLEINQNNKLIEDKIIEIQKEIQEIMHNKKLKIFVLYTRLDASDFVYDIQEHYETHGHQVFVDFDYIKPGANWEEAIRNTISEADIVAVIVTRSALVSSKVEKEVLEAIKQNKTIVSCRYRGISWNDLKWDLNKFQGFQFDNKNSLIRQLDDIIFSERLSEEKTPPKKGFFHYL